MIKDPSTLLLAKCSVIVFFFHCGAAWCTEKAFPPGEPHFPGVYSLCELGTMFVGTVIERSHIEKVPIFERRAPMRGYLLLGFLYLASRFVSLYSLNLIDFRTQVVWKNAKLPVTMLVRSLLLSGVSYTLRSYLVAAIFVVALVFFTAGSNSVSPTFDIIGIPVVMLSLACDALLANVQEKQMREHDAGTSEVMLWSSGLAFVLGLVVFAVPELIPSVGYLTAHPMSFAWIVAATSLCFFGMKAIMLLMQQQGTVVVSAVTSLRKVFTVVLSFLTMGHATFHHNHAVGLALLAIGMGLHTQEMAGSHQAEKAEKVKRDGVDPAGTSGNAMRPLLTKPERRHETAVALGELSSSMCSSPSNTGMV